jgi:hypothetical protein
MRKETWTTGIAGALVLAILLLGRSLAASNVSTTGRANAPQFGVTLGIDQSTYVVSGSGKPMVIHATLTLFNRSSTPMTIHERGQQYEWQILDPQGQVVWDYAKGRMFPMYMRLRTLRQGQIDYTCDVPLHTQTGALLTPGNYTLRGTVTATGASASLPFTIAGSSPAPPN